MKKIFSFLLMALPLMAMLSSCDKEEIIFDHELPQFELRDDAILLEVIMPQGTSADEKIYIAGAFNGGEEAAKADLRWQLEKAPGNDIKWGIYLDPNTFVDGKTLADGFYFVSAEEGAERDVFGNEVVHTDNPAVGCRANITVSRWKSYFDKPVDPGEVVHDGHVVYIVDNTGWDELAMYAYGDAEAFGGWPGIPVTGTETKDGVTYKYFDLGKANEGLTLNLIFNNNNNGSQLPDYNMTVDHDVYLELTADAVVEYDPSQNIEHDGYVAYVIDETGWDALTMYAWGDAEAYGGWPGKAADGTVTIKGQAYKYFDLGEANNGLNLNLIFNNNNGGSQLKDFNFTLERDVYLRLTADGVKEIDPENPGGEIVPTPDPDKKDYTIYVEDKTGWGTLYIYAYGDDNALMGTYPGTKSTGTKTINGVEYKMFPVSGNGENETLLFNDGTDNGKVEGAPMVVNRDYYFTLTATSYTEIDPSTITR